MENPQKKLKYVALGGITGHQMAVVPRPQRWLYISSLFFFGSDLLPPLLPFLYAVMQADVGLFCRVLLSLSPLPPDYIPTSRREEKKEKKRHMQYMDYENKRKK